MEAQRHRAPNCDHAHSGRIEEGVARKSVTMAPTSRYLSDRRYVVRRPLFSAERQTSILKKPHPQEPLHMGKLWSGSVSFAMAPREQAAEEPLLSASESSASPDWTPRLDHPPPLALSDLRGSSPRLPPGRSGSGLLLGPPRLTSTFLGPPRLTSTLLLTPPPPPRPRPSERSAAAGQRPSGGPGCSAGGGRRQTNLLGRLPAGQASYWACALPGPLPPSPDRTSRSWDPDREYEVLLDYTYPLRPGGGSGGGVGGGVLRHADPAPGLQDSGIELDRLDRSLSLSALDRTPGGGRSPHRRDSSGDDGTRDMGVTGGRYRSCMEATVAAAEEEEAFHDSHFIRSTSVLPRARGAGRWQWDEEFRPLPDQLEELQALSRQVREVTTQLSQPVGASSWGSPEPGTSPPNLFPAASPTLLEPTGPDHRETWSNDDRRDPAPSLSEGRRGGGALDGWPWEAPGGLEALAEQMYGPALHEDQVLLLLPSDDGPAHEDSLAERLQHLSSPLTELVAWLHTICDRLTSLAPPSQDINSIKSSLAQYQGIQRDISAHQPLTQAVLHTGERLLQCMDTTCPVLRDTLGRVERQSAVLETRSEQLFSSILSAMDRLTRVSGGGPEVRTRDPGSTM